MHSEHLAAPSNSGASTEKDSVGFGVKDGPARKMGAQVTNEHESCFGYNFSVFQDSDLKPLNVKPGSGHGSVNVVFVV